MQQREVLELRRLRQRGIVELYKGDKAAYNAHVATFPTEAGPLRDWHELYWLRAKFPIITSKSSTDTRFEQLG